MDLLEFGMKNEKSASAVKRAAAHAALAAAKKKADLYEEYLEKNCEEFPEPDSEQMLGKIRERLEDEVR